MNRWNAIVCVVCLAMVTAAAASAQVSTDVMVRYATPTGDFEDAADTGMGLAADVCVGLPLLPIKIGGHVGYTMFGEGENAAGGDTNILEVMPCLRYVIGLPLDIVSFWGQVGAGVANWKNDAADGTDMALSFGLGASARVGLLTSIVVMPTYTVIMAEDDNITYGAVNVGVRF